MGFGDMPPRQENEENNESFSKLETLVRDLGRDAQEQVRDIASQSLFPGKFSRYIDEMTSATGLCIVKMTDRYSSYLDEKKKYLAAYTERVEKLTETPVDIMDFQFETMRVSLDNAPLNAMQNASDKLHASVETLMKMHEGDDELQSALTGIIKEAMSGMMDVYEVMSEQAHKVSDLTREYHMKKAKEDAAAIHKLTDGETIDSVGMASWAEIGSAIDALQDELRSLLAEAASDLAQEASHEN